MEVFVRGCAGGGGWGAVNSSNASERDENGLESSEPCAAYLGGLFG